MDVKRRGKGGDDEDNIMMIMLITIIIRSEINSLSIKFI